MRITPVIAVLVAAGLLAGGCKTATDVKADKAPSPTASTAVHPAANGDNTRELCGTLDEDSHNNDPAKKEKAAAALKEIDGNVFVGFLAALSAKLGTVSVEGAEKATNPELKAALLDMAKGSEAMARLFAAIKDNDEAAVEAILEKDDAVLEKAGAAAEKVEKICAAYQ